MLHVAVASISFLAARWKPVETGISVASKIKLDRALDSKFFWHHHGSAQCPTKDGHVGQRREQISQMPFPIGQDAVDEDSIPSSGKQRSLRLGAIKNCQIFNRQIY